MSIPAFQFNRNAIHKRNSDVGVSNQRGPTRAFSMFSSPFESEALKIFNQVQANRRNVLSNDSSKAYYTKTTVKKVRVDSEGKPVIEEFESTAYCGVTSTGEKVGEVVQKYHNPNTGVVKTSLQRTLGTRSRRVERKRSVDIDITNDTSENMDGNFEREWAESAKNLGARKTFSFDKRASLIGTVPNQ
jgi:hypothetical protein